MLCAGQRFSGAGLVDSFLSHLTGEAQLSSDAERCRQTSVNPNSAALRDSRTVPLGPTPDPSFLRESLTAHPDLAALVHCVVVARAIPASALAVIAGPLLFSAVSLVGATHRVPGGPSAFFAEILRAAPASLHHRLPTDPGFTLVHHVLASKSVIIGQLAAYLLSLQDDRYGDRARAFAGELAESVASAMPGNSSVALAAAAEVRAAGREMSSSLGRGGTVAQAPLLALRRGMSVLLLLLTAQAAAAADEAPALKAAEELVSAQGEQEGLPSVPQASPSGSASLLSSLASSADAFGRTPLHVAGALGDAHSARLLRAWLDEGMVASTAEPPRPRAWEGRDVAGWTPAELARAIGASDVVAALTLDDGTPAEIKDDELPVLPPAAALPPSDGSVDQDDGGWGLPSLVSSAAVRAVEVATAAVDGSTNASACGFAVVDAATLTPDAFARAAYAPRVPVLIRNSIASSARDVWRFEHFLSEWGHVSVSPSTVPGGAAANAAFGMRPPPPIALTTFLDAMRMCDGGDARENPPWVDPNVCAALAGGSGPASVWEALPRGDPLAARLASELPPAVLAATLVRLSSNGSDSSAPTPVFLGEAAGGFVVAQLYVGGPGSGAPPHHHGDAWNGLAWGRKRWALTPPGGASFSTRSAAQTFEQVASAAGTLLCTQEAGDVVYVPRGWGHAVLNLRTSVGWAVEARGPFERYH